ncbi:MAG: hypothetical protein V2A71_10490 [Candidatus Eisenbacteria bacterium]
MRVDYPFRHWDHLRSEQRAAFATFYVEAAAWSVGRASLESVRDAFRELRFVSHAASGYRETAIQGRLEARKEGDS